MRWVAKIPWSELDFSVARSRGPGGQNVNRTNSAVQLRFNVPNSQAFTEQERTRILEKIANKLTTEGDLLIRSEESRDQEMNRKNCIAKLDAHLERAYHRDPPRRKTKPTKSSQRKRVEGKKLKADIKKNRAKVRY